MTYLGFQLRQLMTRMWFLPAAFSALAVATLIVAYVLAWFAPAELPFTMPAEAVQTILQIMASSLLTVAVFALSTMVSALSAASGSTTPRAVSLIAGDLRAQTSISVFIGAFLFSIVGIIGLSAGLYSEAGRLVLFGVTLWLVVLVVASLIRWIGQISAIGRVSNTIDAVEAATSRALTLMAEHPLLGGLPLDDAQAGAPVCAERPGYVQHCDTAELQKLAEQYDLDVAVLARPGAYVTPMRPLLRVEGGMDDAVVAGLRDCFVVGDTRIFDTDPRFGFVVLGEIADKALSPGVNDPGTAIDAIDTATRLLLDWPDEAALAGATEQTHDRVRVVALNRADVLEDVYRPVARDGAGIIEVVIRMLKSLETLAECRPEFVEAARLRGRDALERSRRALSAEADLVDLQRVAGWLE